jgi:hypothetical protein
MLKGYKTYVGGTVTIITAVAAYLVGEADLGTTINLVVTAAMAMFIRDGINTAVKKALDK